MELTSSPLLLIVLISGLGLIWIVYPVVQAMPFEFPGIRPREVAVIVSLINTLAALGFAAGPVVTGLVEEITGSLQTGLIVLSLLTGIGVVSGLLYPSRQRDNGDGVGLEGPEPELPELPEVPESPELEVERSR